MELWFHLKKKEPLNISGHFKEVEKIIKNLQQIADRYKAENKKIAVLSSGTAAIHLSLIMLGVKRNDYVICQSMTFSASANPIKYMDAKAIFIDSEPDTWNMCPKALRKAIEYGIRENKKPKAVICVHLYGMPRSRDGVAYGIPPPCGSVISGC